MDRNSEDFMSNFGEMIKTVLIFAAIITIVVVIRYIIAKHFEYVAFSKRHDESAHAFWMCFFFGIIGVLYVIVLPNLNDVNVVIKKQDTEVDNDAVRGECSVCHRQDQTIHTCKIRRGKSVVEAPMCEDCIQLFISK